MLRVRSDLPLDRDPSGRFLPWLVAVMVYLAALALICAVAANKIVERWDQGLSGQMTVQVPFSESPGDKSADEILAVLRSTAGILEAEILGADEVARLLEPWLGSGAAYQDLPMPILIAVRVDPAAPPDMSTLRRRLTQIAPGTVLDDHQSWLGKLLDVARSVQLVAILVVGLVGASAVTMVIFATRMGLSVHGRVIELLHLIGAQDSYVARQFQAHALRLALRGGVLGLLLAVLTVVVVANLLGRGDVLGIPELTPLSIEWSLLPLLPLVVAVIAMITARLTVLRTLGRMP
jgi:cell division transport system permease protein